MTYLAETYHRDNQAQLPLLREFLKQSGSLESNYRFLENLLDKLARKKDSLFSGNLLLHPRYRRVILSFLKEVIKSHRFGLDRSMVRQLFASPKRVRITLKKVLKAKEYPFRELNQWFCTFTQAVNASMDGKDAPDLWAKTDGLYGEIQDKRGLRIRPECRCWFEPHGGRFRKVKAFDKEAWSALVRRAGSDDQQYASFRINALASLLEELDRHAQ